jgi:hypothetical protein
MPHVNRLAEGTGDGTVEGMRVTFPRLPDYSRGYSIVERDDGVTYRLWGGPVTARLPHDLVHLTVEDALDVGDGIWASIASGVVFDSMDHLRGRRLPHAAERSRRLMKAHGPDLLRAELLGGFVERIAGFDRLDAARVRRLSATWLSVRPPAARVGTHLYGPDGEVDAPRVLAAVERLRQAGADWRAVPVGGKLVRNWPPYTAVPATGARSRGAAPGTPAGHRAAGAPGALARSDTVPQVRRMTTCASRCPASKDTPVRQVSDARPQRVPVAAVLRQQQPPRLPLPITEEAVQVLVAAANSWSGQPSGRGRSGYRRSRPMAEQGIEDSWTPPDHEPG